MKDEQHKNIDDVFRQGINNPANEPEYQEGHWDALEEMLNGKKKPGKMVYWLPLVSAVAAMILIVMGWWFLVPHGTEKANIARVVVKKPKGTGTPLQVDNPATKGNLAQQTEPKDHIATTQGVGIKKPMAGGFIKQKEKRRYVSVEQLAPGFIQPTVLPIDQGVAANISPINRDSARLILGKPANMNLTFVDPIHTIAPVNIINSLPNSVSSIKATQKGRPKNGESWFKKPRLTVTVLASADINGVNSFSNTNAGKNIGMLVSARFNKLSISTGVYYSAKPYNMPFSAYSPNSAYKFKYSPETVTADCRMLDIPLNIDYQVFAKNKNSISVGTGISSFVMLKESYQYNYATTHVYGLSSYNVSNPDKYLFSSVNFQANYRRQINSKIGLNIMPYIKVPLNDIGYSRIKLQTAGVAVGLNWNINSLTKPK
ncbi:hypothetical protein [Mucilaginibacter sp. HD30]